MWTLSEQMMGWITYFTWFIKWYNISMNILNKVCKTNIEVKAVVLKNKVKSESKKFLDKMTEFFEGKILKQKNQE